MAEYLIVNKDLHLKYLESDEMFREFLDRTDVEKEVCYIKVFKQPGVNHGEIIFCNDIRNKTAKPNHN